MARMAGGLGALVCLALLSIAMMAAAGCTGKEAGDTLSEGVCEKLSGLDRDHCYQQIAKFNGDGKLCEKIEHPGPKSKCIIFVEELMTGRERPWLVSPGQRCFLLDSKSSMDGSYTRGDCYQYLAVAWQDPKFCDNLLKYDLAGGSNDLNKQGVSYDTCVRLAGADCGHIGQPACLDRLDLNLQTQKYCLEGQMDRGKCVPEG